jgi:hypothetical protein
MCERVALPGGGFAIVCGGRHKRQWCEDCIAAGRKTESEILCDGPPPAGSRRKTCDRRCCRAHAKRIGPDRDLCTRCARAAARPPIIQTLWE